MIPVTRRLFPVGLWWLLMLLSEVATAQQVGVASSRRCRWITYPAGQDTIRFALPDTLTVLPTSVTLNGRSVAYDARTDQYRLRNPRRLPVAADSARLGPVADSSQVPRRDSVLICYRVLPLHLTAPRYRRPRSLMDSIGFPRYQLGYQDFAVKEQILSTPGINKTGNLSRGVSFGNSQNVFVNSSLNLQLEGKLTDKINLVAAISDQNVPYQPEGNTQQLQEFDRIYVTLTHPRWNLTAGDVVLRNKADYFLRFYKNVQGAAVEARLSTAPRRQSSTVVAAGGAKGKFASVDLPPIENVQGPYRLRGPNGEQFIIVLANSERVYLDGQLMVRGFDFDYTIDYNQAEITFSPRHLITRNSRIKVDFEYSDFNYTRSMLHTSHYQQLGRLSIHANYYRESDNPDNSPNLTLTADDRILLRDAGNQNQVRRPGGGEPVPYNRRLVQYNRVLVTGPAGTPVPVFQLVSDSTQSVYNVSFTDVGVGQGAYQLDTERGNTNGRVFKYVGAGLGNYDAVRVLPAPLQKQMLSTNLSYQLDTTAAVFVDLASSELDLNRLAPGADEGRAMRVGYVVQDRKVAFLRQYRLRSAFDFEYTSHRFAPVDRYRDIEFDRNWSTTSTVQGNVTGGQPREDNILNFSAGLVKDINNAFSYRLSRRYRAGEVDGVQHWLDAAQQVGDLQLRGSLFLLNSQAGDRQSRWARGEAAARFVRGGLVPGYAYRFDKNRVSLPSGEGLTSANYFDEHEVFIQSRDSARTRFRLDYAYRRDQAPNAEQTQLQTRGLAQTWQGTFASRLGKSQDLALLFTYRNLSARDSARQHTVLSKIDWNATLFNNVLRSELSYSVATGRELRRDYSYLPVNNGQGTHYWRDTNGDGRQDKDEFFEAQTPEPQFRTFIKVYLPTDDYVLAFTNRFSYRLTTSAPRQWREKGGWRAFGARFSTITSVALDNRTTDENLAARLNPVALQTESDQLLSMNKLLRNTLYFNRSNPIFGSEFTVQQTQQKTLLTGGGEIRNLASQSLLLRRTLAQSFTGRLITTRSIRQNEASYLIERTRDYRILGYEVQPEISYQPTNVLRLTATYLHSNKKNVLGNPEEETQGVFDELGVETRISQVSKRTVSATTRYVRVGFEGNQASVVGIEILNALRPGNNLTWNLNVEQRLSNGLNVSLAYDGRKANGLNVVHTGRMQVSVLF